jgi:hypothetical protein
MTQVFSLVIAGLTSVGMYVVGVRGLGLSGNGLRAALSKALECVGGILAFFIMNLVLGVVIILTARLVTRGFVSLYLASDPTLLVLSSLQGIAFQGWREVSRRHDGARQ